MDFTAEALRIRGTPRKATGDVVASQPSVFSLGYPNAVI